MKVNRPSARKDLDTNEKASLAFDQFNRILEELEKKELLPSLIDYINDTVQLIDEIDGTPKDFKKQLKKHQSKMLHTIAKKQKIVTPGYYRNLWMAVGMAGIGMPIGVAFGASMDNMGLLGIGIPIGLAIGIAIGTSMDKKAEEEGRQIGVTIKHY